MATTWDAQYSNGTGCRFWPNEELVRSLADWEPGGQIFDVGCGNGANLAFLATKGYVVGLETSDVALEMALKEASRIGSPDIEIRRGDALATGYADGCGDLVVDCMTSQHLPWRQHIDVYREYHRILSHTVGMLWLFHLDAETMCACERVSGSLYDYRNVSLFPEIELISMPRPVSLQAIVQQAGFSNIKMRGLAREYADGRIAHYTIIEAEA